MKGRSKEAKGHKSTGGGRTWYGKRETLTPMSDCRVIWIKAICYL